MCVAYFLLRLLFNPVTIVSMQRRIRTRRIWGTREGEEKGGKGRGVKEAGERGEIKPRFLCCFKNRLLLPVAGRKR